MNISVRAFASYREALGAARLQLTAADGATPARVWEDLLARFPRLRALPPPTAFAVNDEYVPPEAALRSGDELILIPPVSGGAPDPAQPAAAAQAAPAVWVELVERPIEIDRLLARVRHPQAGAVVLFLGTVRQHSRGHQVRHLDYEAYQTMALREMRRVAAEAAARWSLLGIGLVHRLGRLEVGEVSVAIVVAAGHRPEAFAACRFAIDTLKQTVPIWKKEVWDGGEAWVGSEPGGGQQAP